MESGRRRYNYSANILSLEQGFPIRIVVLDLELKSHSLGAYSVRVGNSDESSRGNSATQILSVAPPQGTNSNHSHPQFVHGIALSYSIDSSRLENPTMPLPLSSF